jgi:hypothetical protein
MRFQGNHFQMLRRFLSSLGLNDDHRSVTAGVEFLFLYLYCGVDAKDLKNQS